MTPQDDARRIQLTSRFLTLLVCTVTGERLRLMNGDEIAELNAKIRDGLVRSHSNSIATSPIEGGLLAQEAGLVYPIRDDIPFLLPDDALTP